MLKLLVLLNIVVFTPETVPTEPGTYPVEIEYRDENVVATEVIQLTVISTDTVTEERIAIDAKDFTVGEDADITKDLVVSLSNAKAWNMDTGEEYVIDRMDLFRVDDELYRVTLYSFDDISADINVYVEKDYYNTVVLTDDIPQKIPVELREFYSFQSITYLVIFLFLIFLVLILVRKYNHMMATITDQIEENKVNVRKT